MDETKFQIGCRKAHLVVIMNSSKLLKMIHEVNHDYITSIECIGSAGKIISPMLLISWVNTLHNWCYDNILDSEIFIGTTETDYANDDIELD